jgi:hypothetical protein
MPAVPAADQLRCSGILLQVSAAAVCTSAAPLCKWARPVMLSSAAGGDRQQGLPVYLLLPLLCLPPSTLFSQCVRVHFLVAPLQAGWTLGPN